jgi:hypothetical protein
MPGERCQTCGPERPRLWQDIAVGPRSIRLGNRAVSESKFSVLVLGGGVRGGVCRWRTGLCTRRLRLRVCRRCCGWCSSTPAAPPALPTAASRSEHSHARDAASGTSEGLKPRLADRSLARTGGQASGWQRQAAIGLDLMCRRVKRVYNRSVVLAAGLAVSTAVWRRA